MVKTILEQVNEKKFRISMTIDESLFKELKKWINEKKLKSLSPLINKLLWKWLEDQKR